MKVKVMKITSCCNLLLFLSVATISALEIVVEVVIVVVGVVVVAAIINNDNDNYNVITITTKCWRQQQRKFLR